MNYRQRALSAAIAVLVLPACVSIKTVPLVGGRSPSLEGKSITLAARSMPAFGLVSSSKMFAGALFGGLGMGAAAASGMNAGREMARQNQLEDPAVAAGKSLLGELASNNQMTIVDTAALVTYGQKPEEIARPYPKVDFVLDVETVNWSALYLPLHPSKYGIVYGTRLQLIDVKSGLAMAAASCVHRPDSAPDAPTYDELLANQAAKIKELSKSAAQQCQDELRSKAFGAAH